MVQLNGIANIIYVKNFVSETHENTEKSRDSKNKCKKATGEDMAPAQNLHQRNFDTATSVESEPVPGEKLHLNNKESNNNLINNNPISQFY